MTPRMLTSPPTDKRMWRQLLAAVHPDRNGCHDLFIWAQGLYEHVAGNDPEPVVDDRSRRQRYADSKRDVGERVDYAAAFDRGASFDDLTRYALAVSSEVDEPFASVLRMLLDCYEVAEHEGGFYRQQHQGATYKQLAAIAYRVGMSQAQRSRWYRIAESIPLSQRHAGHLLERLQGRAA